MSAADEAETYLVVPLCDLVIRRSLDRLQHRLGHKANQTFHYATPLRAVFCMVSNRVTQDEAAGLPLRLSRSTRPRYASPMPIKNTCVAS
jgi:hypothetical protein